MSWRRPLRVSLYLSNALVAFGLLPGGGDEPAALHTVERGIKRSRFDRERVTRVRTNGLRDAVAVSRSPLQCLQDQHVERALKQLDAVLIGRGLRS